MDNDDLAGTAPEEVSTAVTSTDPVQTGETNSPDAEKVFSQEELDQAIGKGLPESRENGKDSNRPRKRLCQRPAHRKSILNL